MTGLIESPMRMRKNYNDKHSPETKAINSTTDDQVLHEIEKDAKLAGEIPKMILNEDTQPPTSPTSDLVESKTVESPLVVQDAAISSDKIVDMFNLEIQLLNLESTINRMLSIGYDSSATTTELLTGKMREMVCLISTIPLGANMKAEWDEKYRFYIDQLGGEPQQQHLNRSESTEELARYLMEEDDE